MRGHKAFTLVELLVVIAIIALLMSILMPALGRVRKQAKSTLCQANLRQWGYVFSMYTSDHDGCFNPGDGIDNPFEWMEVTESYYKEEMLRYCPMATKFDGSLMGGKAMTWEWDPYYGSYGINEFVFNPPMDEIWGHENRLNWRCADIPGVSNIPLFLDAAWCGGLPTYTDAPPEYDDQPWTHSFGDNMVRFCLDRHDGHINAVFMDFSTIRQIGLKELWSLNWHRQYNFAGPWTIVGGVKPADWPEWMRNFKDY